MPIPPELTLTCSHPHQIYVQNVRSADHISPEKEIRDQAAPN